MYSWRITKYNPMYRDAKGNFKKAEWTSISDIGLTFSGQKFILEEYLKMEQTYIDAVMLFLNSMHVESLKVCCLEKINKRLEIDERFAKIYTNSMVSMYKSIRNNDDIHLNTIEDICRLILRQNLWCKLEINKMFVHFGYDYYMYIGSMEANQEILDTIVQSGLYVEPFESPYNDEIVI